MSPPKPSAPPANQRRVLAGRLSKRRAELRAAPAAAATQNPSTSAADPSTATAAPALASQGDSNPAHGDGRRDKRVREAAREATATADAAAPIESATTNPFRPVENPYKKQRAGGGGNGNAAAANAGSGGGDSSRVTERRVSGVAPSETGVEGRARAGSGASGRMQARHAARGGGRPAAARTTGGGGGEQDRERAGEGSGRLARDGGGRADDRNNGSDAPADPGGDGIDGGAAGDGDGDGNGGAEAAQDEREDEYWPEHCLAFFRKCREEIDNGVQMVRNNVGGTFKGRLPQKYRDVLSPSRDPLDFYGISKAASAEEFCLPDLFVWWPEAKYQGQVYAGNRPCCKWHGKTDCGRHNGWMPSPRHACANNRVVAVQGRRYYCAERKEAGEHPFGFTSIDPDVIARGPEYIQLMWQQFGFDFSHRAGISNEMLHHMRSDLIQGLGINPFRQSHLEGIQRYHFGVGAKYRAYVDILDEKAKSGGSLFVTRDAVKARMVDFPAYNSDAYHQSIPSNAYLIERVVRLMETDADYTRRRMQMVDGEHLSGDHSFKLAKTIYSDGGKPFAAMYSIMNEFGQVVAWWLTDGTQMDELKASIRMLKQRYYSHGFEGVKSFTTDRCCDERRFWNRIFCFLDNYVSDANVPEEDLKSVEVVDMPYESRAPAYTHDVSLQYVSDILEKLEAMPPELQVVIFDGEWRIGHSRADVAIIDLLNDEPPYIFCLTRAFGNAASLPRFFAQFLEDPRITKVGNRICSDVSQMRGWDVELKPALEMGHLAGNRSVTQTRAPSLEAIVSGLWPGVEIADKHEDGGPRTGDWSSILTERQVRYASNDGYITRKGYQRLMQIMDPRPEARLHLSDNVRGTAVTIYAAGWNARVARGTLVGSRVGTTRVAVEIDISDDRNVFAPGCYVQVVGADGVSLSEKQSIASLKEGDASVIRIVWELLFCRRTVNRSGSATAVTIHTRSQQVLVDDGDDDSDWEDALLAGDGDEQEATAADDVTAADAVAEGEDETALDETIAAAFAEDDDDLGGNEAEDDDNGNASESADDATDSATRERRRQHRLGKERVKNDIAHIFLRLEKVLSKEHGAYQTFRIALRDAMFVPNQDDLDNCLRVLRTKHQLTDKEIERKIRTNFRWFKRRVRRLVPPPKELMKRYLDVFREFRGIKCSKSGKALFGSKAALTLHKNIVLHIRKNCLSDIPLVNYYTTIGADKDGLALYKCIRGTSALEGLHQKLRQLVRGYSNSPRFMKSLISEFLLRWNQNIDINVRGLSDQYEGLYVGDRLEIEIEKLSKWPDCAAPPHPEWRSSRNVSDTGETFGILDRQAQRHIDEQRGVIEDPSLVVAARAADEEIAELESGTAENTDALVSRHMPASSLWLASVNGRTRPYGRVKCPHEWDHFNEKLASFQCVPGQSGEADNHSSISWGQFANEWNTWVDSLGNMKPDVTYKSATLLQTAFQARKKRAIERATLHPHKEKIDTLQQGLRDREANQSYLPQFAPATKASVARPNECERAAQPPVPPPIAALPVCLPAAATAPPPPPQAPANAAAPPATVKRTREPRRCRTCGLNIIDFPDEHRVPQLPGQKCAHNNASRYCRIPEDQREPHFPLAPGQKMPKKRKHNR